MSVSVEEALLEGLDSDPRLVELCLNCKHKRCIGICEEYTELRRMISSYTKRAKLEGKKWEMNGRTQTLTKWANEYGIPERTLRSRVERGIPLSEALKVGKLYEGKTYKAFGKEQTISAWCKEYRINNYTLRYRLKHGMSMEKALVMGRNRHG